MSDAQFAAATARLHADGVDIYGPSGVLSKSGVTGTYQFADGKLTIEVTDHPFFMPLALIEGTLRAYFEQDTAGSAL